MTVFRITMITAAVATFAAVGLAQERGRPATPGAPATAESQPSTAPVVEASEAPNEASGSNGTPPHEAEIQQADAAFVTAFNSKDAKAIAELWTPHAVYVNRVSGEEVEGREAIAAQYASQFEAAPELKLDIHADSIQLLSPGVAVEHGTATFLAPDSEPEAVNFVAVWTRSNGRWFLDRVTDQDDAPPSPQHEHLNELEWMIGDWIDQDEALAVETECKWAKNRNFLVRSFGVSVDGAVEISGMQIVGWNPLTKRLQSWTFDSDGGFAEGAWTKEGDRWFIHNRGVLADGRLVTMTNVIRPIDENSFGWRTIGQNVEGELLPNVDEVRVVRRP